MSLIKQNSEEIIKNFKMGATELGAPSTVPSHAPEARSAWNGQMEGIDPTLLLHHEAAVSPWEFWFNIPSPVLHRAPQTGRLSPPMSILRGCGLRDRKPPARAHTAGGAELGLEPRAGCPLVGLSTLLGASSHMAPGCELVPSLSHLVHSGIRTIPETTPPQGSPPAQHTSPSPGCTP